MTVTSHTDCRIPSRTMLLSSLSVVAIMRVIRFFLPPVVEASSVSSMPRLRMIVVVIVIALVAVALAIAVVHVPHAVHSTRPWVGSSTRPVVVFARLRAFVIS